MTAGRAAKAGMAIADPVAKAAAVGAAVVAVAVAVDAAATVDHDATDHHLHLKAQSPWLRHGFSFHAHLNSITATSGGTQNRNGRIVIPIPRHTNTGHA